MPNSFIITNIKHYYITHLMNHFINHLMNHFINHGIMVECHVIRLADICRESA